MKIARVLLVMVLGMCTVQASEQLPLGQSVQFQVAATQHDKMPLLVMFVGGIHKELEQFAAELKKDLEFTKQFDVTMRACAQLSSKTELQSYAQEGFALVVFINEADIKKKESKSYEWRLYDATFAQMVKGKKYHKRGELVRGWAHNVADMLWPELTADEGFFSTKIAYCKEVTDKKNRRFKHIFMADYDGSHEQRVVGTPTVNVAPRFNRDTRRPLLFYSESAQSNVRLMIADLHGHARVASNFDGINMLPAFSADGTKLVYCASHGHGDCQLYYYDKFKLKQITDNHGNNVSPSLSDDGTRLFFCSDYATGKPQIYCYNFVSGTQTPVTGGVEACYCPAYCGKKGLLAYVKMIKGSTQLFVYNEATGQHKQLTFDAGHKEECSWSPCGNFLVYGVEKGNKGRIAMLNMMTNEHQFITDAKDVCSFPTWSPVYAEYPVVV